jgi:hydrogenase maturation factor
MANDMATTGLAPQYGQFVLNLPPSLHKQDFKTYWQYIDHYCKEIGVAITGGHTGFAEGQYSTIAGGGTFTTVALESDFRLSSYAEVGDVLLMTKECALSSTAILALSFPEAVKNKIGKERQQAACDAFYKTSSLQDALIAVAGDKHRKQVTAMHDVTEGGVVGAAYEMAVAAGIGIEIYDDKLPIGEVHQAVCEIFDLDPRYCIGAGAMLIACKAEAKQPVLTRLEQHHIRCTEIGVFTEADQGLKLVSDDGIKPLEYQAIDPYWEAFAQALKRGVK